MGNKPQYAIFMLKTNKKYYNLVSNGFKYVARLEAQYGKIAKTPQPNNTSSDTIRTISQTPQHR